MGTTIDSRLLEALQASTCFGIAHDETVPECQQCDVKAQCMKKSEGADIPTPTSRVVTSTPKPETTSKKSATASKTKTTTKAVGKSKPKTETKKVPTPSNPANLPDFKPMSLDELKDMAQERSVEWKDYGNDSITRMRLIMALKKSF